MPFSLTTLHAAQSYGNFLHALARVQANRRQSFGTFFLRNRPELELMQRLLRQIGKGSALRITVLACSTGAEVYSILWAIRSARPDLKIKMHAVDISKEVVSFAEKGVYSLKSTELQDPSIFERMTSHEIEEMFEREGDKLKIRPWIKEGISWLVGNAGDHEILKALGSQDMVVANRFLCHMDPSDAEKCLRNVARVG